MNSRERLYRCYNQLEIDRPAVYVRTGFPAQDPTYDALKEYLALHSDRKANWNGRGIEEPYQINEQQRPYTDDFSLVVRTMKTKRGNLRSVYQQSTRGNPGMVTEHFIKTEEDISSFLSLPFPDLIDSVASFFSTDIEIGEDGITDVFLGYNPAGQVVELMGSETFALMSVTNRDLIHELCQREMNIILNTVKRLIDAKVGPYFSMLGQEYLVPPLHGPRDFYDFNVRYDKPIIDLLHESGGRVHVHCHGPVKKVIHGFIDMGADVVHPFEAPPVGDISAKEAKSIIRGRICFEGNIQISSMYDHTPEVIRTETECLIRDVFNDGKGLIVCPTASPYVRGKGMVCLDQFKAMIDTVTGWKL